MPVKLYTSDANFDAAFSALLARRRGGADDVTPTVQAILAAVRAKGDAGLLDYTRRFDGYDLTADRLRVSAKDVRAARKAAPAEAMAALKLAAQRIKRYHRRQKPKNIQFTDAAGVELGERWNAIASVGLYVPGGKAAYPSSVLMNALPARLAGVERVVMVAPAPKGELNPLVLAAADLCGVSEIYRVGGAQAVAALAYGTETIRPVDKIVGPGNAYVACAKRLVFGTVGIDTIAGPSEIVVVADQANDPAWIAADLLAQAEHDEHALVTLMTDDAAFASAVEAALAHQRDQLPRAKIATQSWQNLGAVIVLKTLGEAPALIDAMAPEHLALAVADPKPLFALVRNAGAVFLGRYTPEAIGDYVAGPNHVLPTGGAARYSSGLSVQDFMKRTTVMACDGDGLAAIGPCAMTLAEAEGLSAHARSIGIRLNKRG